MADRIGELFRQDDYGSLGRSAGVDDIRSDYTTPLLGGIRGPRPQPWTWYPPDTARIERYRAMSRLIDPQAFSETMASAPLSENIEDRRGENITRAEAVRRSIQEDIARRGGF